VTTPLFIHPYPAWVQYRDIFRRAKAADPALAKVSLQPTEAHPACQRLIAFGDHPDFVAEYALVRRKPAELTETLASQILRWYCGVQDDSRIIGYEDWLGRVLGREVKEVWE
jgi:hypothetical protein